MRRTRLFFLFGLLPALLLLLGGSALAVPDLILESDTICIGETISFRVEGAAPPLSYSLSLDQTELFRTEETDRVHGSYIPRKSGTYTLRVFQNAGEESAEAVFTVTSELVLRLDGPDEALCAGDAAVFFAEASGGDAPYTYQYTVAEDRVTLYGRTGRNGQFVYTAADACELTVRCTVTDRQGTSASAETHLSVAEGPGLSVDGDVSSFLLYGGTRTYVVHSPGIWTASADADFIRLSTDCGADGGELEVTVLPDGETPETGSVTVSSGSSSCTIPITRLATDGIEKEVSLLNNNEGLTVDGDTLSVWMNAEGEREFSVVSVPAWDFTCESDWIHAERSLDGNLNVRVDPCVSSARSGYIHVTNDSAHAYISIFQASHGLTPSVTDVILDQAGGFSYHDTITARVWLSDDADRLIVYTSSKADPLTFERSAVSVTEDRMWTVRIPLENSGQEQWLFAAQNYAGIGETQLVTVNALMEDAMFASTEADALVEEDICTVTVRVTSSVNAIALLNENGTEYGSILYHDADIDQYINAGNHGRYSDWTFTLPAAHIPTGLRIGYYRIPVVIRYPQTEYPLYSQFDGTWSAADYRHSDLQTSGCAIFTLSTALHKLGFSGAETMPESLAESYAFCLVDGGTLNSTLIGNAAKEFGFRTRYNLYEDKAEILSLFEQGALFSFSIVKGHIALADGVSEDMSMVHITDSALSATFTRIEGTRIFIRQDDGTFTPVSDPDEIPGAVYYVETGAYSGGCYWLPIDYVVSRGVRLILAK